MTLPFDEFDHLRVDVGDVVIHARVAGTGPALLLLHGYPESSYMWRHVAPALAESFTVVAADLRGYGESSAPADDQRHSVYSFRSMAADQVALMDALGHRSFLVVGHDRGGRVAHRMALDCPERVERVAVLDIVPTLHMYENVDRAMAETYFHWFFLSRSSDLPERLISADPESWIASRFRGRTSTGWQPEPSAFDQYVAAFRDPARVAATCADYRAAASIDLEHDRADRDTGRTVGCPLLAMWGEAGYVGRSFDVAEVWERYADDVVGVAVPSDHYLPEEAPLVTTRILASFLEGRTVVRP